MTRVAAGEAVTMIAARTMLSWATLRSPIRLGLSLAGVAWIVYVFGIGGWGFDFYAYWTVDPTHPYAVTEGLGAFHYAPPLVWLAGPLRALPFEPAYLAWIALMVGALVWMTRSWALAWCAFPPVVTELYHGNMHLLLAAVVVLGFRHAPAWGLLPLAKVTSGIAILWPLVRRDWRALAGAAAAVGLVVGVSVVLQGPEIWADWIGHLVTRAGVESGGGALIGVPLLVRLPLALGIGWAAAATGRPWLMAVAVTLALPLLWWHSLSMLVALQPLTRLEVARERPVTA